jgi:hypothetical protein
VPLSARGGGAAGQGCERGGLRERQHGRSRGERAKALEQKTNAEFRRCFARSAAKEAKFADVVKRAGGLYGMMKERSGVTSVRSCGRPCWNNYKPRNG